MSDGRLLRKAINFLAREYKEGFSEWGSELSAKSLDHARMIYTYEPERLTKRKKK